MDVQSQAFSRKMSSLSVSSEVAHPSAGLKSISLPENASLFEPHRQRLCEIVLNPEIGSALIAIATTQENFSASLGNLPTIDRPGSLALLSAPEDLAAARAQRRNLYLLGVKSGFAATPEKLIEEAFVDMLHEKQDLALVNWRGSQPQGSKNLSFILTAERGVEAVKLSEMVDRLIEIMQQRFSRKHFRTELSKVSELPLPAAEVADFIKSVREISHLALFPKYHAAAREEFGFVAKRTAQGTLISARGSSKSIADVSDVALVTNVDFESRVLKVSSVKNRASLNASMAHAIFALRPEINCIVHAHINLPGALSVERQTSPGTLEDWEGIKPFVLAGRKLIALESKTDIESASGETQRSGPQENRVISQTNHGVFILLSEMEELTQVLENSHIYSSRADCYDAAYHRFLGKARLVELLKEQAPLSAKVLDMAAGTGDVSSLLLQNGYKDISLMDVSAPMLEVAKRKLGDALSLDRYSVGRMQDLSAVQVYDAIVVRQAINYLADFNELKNTLSAFRRALRAGGCLLFNSFDPLVARNNPARFSRELAGDNVLLTTEGNSYKDGKIFHGQRTEIYNSLSGSYDLVYDLNVFSVFTPQQFEDAMQQAGFKSTRLITEGRSVYLVGLV